jgi:hypothetical protein
MNENRFLKDMLYERSITCLSPGDHVYLVRNMHYSDWRTGVHRIEPEFGCELVREYHENGAYFATLKLSKTLSAGESFEFIYRIHVTTDQPFGCFVFLAPPADIQRLEYHIQFAEDAVPSAYWTFSRVNYLDTLDQDSRRQVSHAHDGSRFIFASWQNVRKGLSYGVDWAW